MKKPANGPAPEALEAWLGLIRYYGALVERPGWEDVRPLFELVKQISTSHTCAAIFPTLVEDTLYLTRLPLGEDPTRQPRLTLELTESHQFLFKQYAANSRECRELACTSEQAFNALVHIVRTL